jgi:hypothetical protein
VIAAFVIAAKNAFTLHFLSNRFATIEVEERIEVRPQAEPKAPKAIRFRYEHFRKPKPALLDCLHLRECARISIVFSYLQRIVRAGMVPLPPVAT